MPIGAERPWLGERVRRLREQRAMTQAELSRRSGVSLATVARLEQTSWPVLGATVKRLAKALGVRQADLLVE